MASAKCYAPKAVPAAMEPVIAACLNGDLESLKRSWRPHFRGMAHTFGRDDTCHPLLHAAHRLHVELVRFLLDEGLSPRLRGTVHPYTGDCFMVSDTQGANSS